MTEEKSHSDNRGVASSRKWQPLALMLVAFVLIILGWAGFPWVESHVYDDMSKRALLGDSYGAFNALVSGLAILFAGAAFLLQRQELANQIREMQNTRTEIELGNQVQALSALCNSKATSAAIAAEAWTAFSASPLVQQDKSLLARMMTKDIAGLSNIGSDRWTAIPAKVLTARLILAELKLAQASSDLSAAASLEDEAAELSAAFNQFRTHMEHDPFNNTGSEAERAQVIREKTLKLIEISQVQLP